MGGPQVPPSSEVYDYIIFKGEDGKGARQRAVASWQRPRHLKAWHLSLNRKLLAGVSRLVKRHGVCICGRHAG